MHFSASIAQLLATIVMTALRVVIRRHISQPPKKLSASSNEAPRPAPQTHTSPPGNADGQQVQFQMPCHKDYAVQELTSGLELDIISLQLQRCRRWQILTYVDLESPPPQQPLHVAQGNVALGKPLETLAQKVFGTRIRLSELVQSPWHTDHEIRDHAQKLSDTIADLANFVWKLGDTPGGLLELESEFLTKREIAWNLLVETQGANSESPCREELSLFVQRDQIEGQKWKLWEVDGSRVDALLHLWIQQLRTDKVEDGNMLWLLCPQGDDRAPMIADWWIGRESCIVKGQELDEICREYSIVRSTQGRPDKSRIVGCVGTHKDPRAGSTISGAATGIVARAIIQNTTLISFTTQYILYTFLCKLVDSIARITPETHIEETGQGTVLLANKAITELAHKMQERGLMGVADAYKMIVCALYAGGKLPLTGSQEPSFFNVYNDALELGFRVNRKDIFHEAQEMCAMEVEWLLAQNRSAEAAILLIKAIQRCVAISMKGENKPGEESWVKDRLRGMAQNVADQFVSAIPKPVPSSSSIGTCTNATPAVPGPLMATPVQPSLEEAICSNEVAVVHTLIKNGAMVNESLNPSGIHPIDCAAREHHRDMIILLYLHGASLGRAPMWWAIEGGNAGRSSEGDCLGVVRLLSELGSNPNNAEPRTGQLPLHAAAKSNFAEIVAWLMAESGYDISVNAGDKEGLTALHYAAKEGHGSMLRSLIEVHHARITYGSTTNEKTALHYAAIHEDLLTLEMLCDQVGVDLEARCSEGKSALLYASQRGNYAIIEALTSRGADINAKDDLRESTGLHLAAIEGHARAIRFLLDKGAIIDGQDKDGKTALHYAAKEARGLVVYILLSKGALCDLCDKSGKTALDYARYNLEETTQGRGMYSRAVYEGIVWVLEHAAVIWVTNTSATGLQRASLRGDVPAVKMLLAIGVDTEEKDNVNGYTALICGAYSGHEEVVQALLDSGANIDNSDPDLTTPLHVAAANGHEQIVRLLLDRGAKINAKEKDGTTPLFIAVMNGHEQAVQLLLEGGAETEAKPNDTNTTALYLAAWNGNEQIVQLLLESGADIEGANENGGILLYTAARSGHERVVELLLEGGAQIGVANENGPTLLYIAAQYGYERVVQLLLERGAEIDVANKNGETPLYTAARSGHERVVELLLEGGAQIGVAIEDGPTLLYIAAQYGYERVVQLLLERGAEVDIANENGETPLYTAAQSGHERVVQLLLDRGAETGAKLNSSKATPLHIAAQKGHERVVQLLLKDGADIEVINEHGATPLYEAAVYGHERVVRLLLEGGAKTEVKLNFNNTTPLYMAAQNGHEQVVRLLLEHGAKTEAQHNVNNTTPLYMAAQNGHERIVQLLLGSNAKVDVMEKSGYGATPLLSAASKGYERIVQLLQDAGAELGTRDNYGRTVLHVATQAQQPAMIEFLIARGADPSIKDNMGNLASDYAEAPFPDIQLNPKVLEVWRSLQPRTGAGRVAQNEGTQGVQGGMAMDNRHPDEVVGSNSGMEKEEPSSSENQLVSNSNSLPEPERVLTPVLIHYGGVEGSEGKEAEREAELN